MPLQIGDVLYTDDQGSSVTIRRKVGSQFQLHYRVVEPGGFVSEHDAHKPRDTVEHWVASGEWTLDPKRRGKIRDRYTDPDMSGAHLLHLWRTGTPLDKAQMRVLGTYGPWKRLTTDKGSNKPRFDTIPVVDNNEGGTPRADHPRHRAGPARHNLPRDRHQRRPQEGPGGPRSPSAKSCKPSGTKATGSRPDPRAR